MDTKLKEMEAHLIDAGINYFQVFIASTRSICDCVDRDYKVTFDWASPESVEYCFKTFAELYDFVMQYTGKKWTCTGTFI